jgi:hypothetical protein
MILERIRASCHLCSWAFQACLPALMVASLFGASSPVALAWQPRGISLGTTASIRATRSHLHHRRPFIALTASESSYSAASSVAEQERATSDGSEPRKQRRQVLFDVVRFSFLLAANPSAVLAASVSWPGADGGLVKGPQPATKSTVASRGSQDPTFPDGREELALREVDFSSLSFTGLPKGEAGVRAGVRQLVQRDPKIAAALLRLAFHDSVTRDTGTRQGGANGSIRFELDRRANYGLSRAVQALAPIQAAAALSWADTIALAGAEAVEAVGGPPILVEIGREDASSADPLELAQPIGKCVGPSVPGGGISCRGQVQTTIPDAGLDSDGVRLYFGRLGFSEEETVALMGGHTVGRFTSLLGVPKKCLKGLNDNWERCLPFGERLPFVSEDPDRFSNSYYRCDP